MLWLVGFVLGGGWMGSKEGVGFQGRKGRGGWGWCGWRGWMVSIWERGNVDLWVGLGGRVGEDGVNTTPRLTLSSIIAFSKPAIQLRQTKHYIYSLDQHYL